MFHEIHKIYSSAVEGYEFDSILSLGEEKVAELQELTERVNKSNIPTAIETLFVRPYADFTNVDLKWKLFIDRPVDPLAVVRCEGGEDKRVLYFDHIAFLSFLKECDNAEEVMHSRTGRADFRTYRLNAFLRELKKLPIKYLAFICVLREIARQTEISKCERLRRDKEPQITDVNYISLLWAFKELETRIALTNHTNLRADYKLFWYESEWVDCD